MLCLMPQEILKLLALSVYALRQGHPITFGDTARDERVTHLQVRGAGKARHLAMRCDTNCRGQIVSSDWAPCRWTLNDLYYEVCDFGLHDFQAGSYPFIKHAKNDAMYRFVVNLSLDHEASWFGRNYCLRTSGSRDLATPDLDIRAALSTYDDRRLSQETDPLSDILFAQAA